MTELGEITRCYSLRYERSSKHPPARLWRAITDPVEVTRWMSYRARIELRVGGAYFVDFSRTAAENLDGVIVRIEPDRQLAYVWGTSVVEWRLEPSRSGSRYKFLHHGMARRGVPDEEGVAVGWHRWLDALDGHLSETRGVAANAAELARSYRARLDAVLG